MDKLQEILNYYKDNLQNQEIELYAGRKGQQIMHLTFDFSSEHLKHLMGLHKLEDFPGYARESSNLLLKRIERGELTLDRISGSSQFAIIESRLDCILKIKDIVTNAKKISKSIKGRFLGIEADYMLSNKDEKLGNIHLFLKKGSNNKIVPVSILNCDHNKYLEVPCSQWTILPKERIEQQNKNRQEENTKKENTSNSSQQLGNEDNKSFCAYEEKSDDGIKTELRMSNKVNAEATQIVDERNKQSQLIEQNKQTEKVNQVGHSGKQNQQNNKKGRGK